MTRAIYGALLWLHPPHFRERFAAEMLWLFDETVAAEGAGSLLADGLLSLMRQWLLRRMTWKLAAAVAGGVLEVGIVLALSRNIYSPGAVGVSGLSVRGNARAADSGGLTAGRAAAQHRAARPELHASPADSAATPARMAPVGEKPLAFFVLFVIVLVYAFQGHRFGLRVAAASGAGSAAGRYPTGTETREARRVPAKSKPHLSILAD
ncbi:MAG TPA: hypothetical protein VG860_03085 [Terriglobia bacterium]|jgi:hypothetical protein|nr:hypothetical protein [Terriglobia bacterium]